CHYSSDRFLLRSFFACSMLFASLIYFMFSDNVLSLRWLHMRTSRCSAVPSKILHPVSLPLLSSFYAGSSSVCWSQGLCTLTLLAITAGSRHQADTAPGEHYVYTRVGYTAWYG